MGIEQMIDSASDNKEKRRLYKQNHQTYGSYATQGDIKNLEKKITRTIEENERKKQQQQTQNMGQKAIKWIGSGFGNIAQSLNHPSDARRMRIAQMPSKLSEMDIIRKPNLSLLKQANIRDRDIRGRREKVRSRRNR